MDQVRTHFNEKDLFARYVGIILTEVTQASARAELVIAPHHFNAFGIVHGGVLFTLAESAFAAAANSYGTVSLSINTHMSYTKAATSGRLVATASEISSSRKLATYRVDVTDETGEIIAIFEGMAYRKKDPL